MQDHVISNSARALEHDFAKIALNCYSISMSNQPDSNSSKSGPQRLGVDGKTLKLEDIIQETVNHEGLFGSTDSESRKGGASEGADVDEEERQEDCPSVEAAEVEEQIALRRRGMTQVERQLKLSAFTARQRRETSPSH